MSPVELHYTVEGVADGPPLVLGASLGTDTALWQPQVPELAGRFRLIRYDHRGHGRSPVPPGPYRIEDLGDDLLALLDRLGVARAHLVGLSLGGMTALRLAARNPERVDRMAVLCTSARLGPAQGWLDRAATVRAEGTGAVAEAVVGRWYTEAYAAAHPAEVAASRAMVASVPAEGYAGCCEAIASMDLTADLADISAPTLAVAGAEDLATPPEHLERIASGVKDGSLLVLPQAAHVAALEQPEAVTRALLDHLSRR